MKNILVTGAAGQIGTELVTALRQHYGKDAVVIATGRRTQLPAYIKNSGPFCYLNVMDRNQLEETAFENNVDTIYHMASILSAVGEQKPQLAWDINMNGLYNVLEVARTYDISVMWPSSIAVFGPDTPKVNTPNDTILRPTTIYGVTKVAGELLANYYYHKYGVDVRSVRYPGIISSETPPGGGTTDYAVAIYYDAVQQGSYTCFVREDTVLPMMYMPDAIKGLIDLAEADNAKLKHRIFNIGSMSFSVGTLAQSIKEIIPDFTIDYKPDFRQAIADSWPQSVDDSVARAEWNWDPEYDLAKMTKDMIEKLREKFTKDTGF
ncbi:UDP-glucose 4-epimerase [Candidatus Heimdallarchaeota archaeon B3_Heim]|nr:MAG: UDP-glucose 4-epimerase [Candidatus Heimdallarchaeota archaeon B3_Heim]